MPHDGRRPRILIVNDDRALCAVLVTVLAGPEVVRYAGAVQHWPDHGDTRDGPRGRGATRPASVVVRGGPGARSCHA